MADYSIVQFFQVLFLTCWTLCVIETNKHASPPAALTASEISTVSKNVSEKEFKDLDVENQSQNTTHVHFIIDNITTYKDGGNDSGGGDTFPRDDVSEYSTYSNNQNVTCSRIFIAYLTKCTGIKGMKSPIRSSILDILISSLLSFIGILVVSTTSFRLLADDKTAVTLLTGAYAATGGMQCVQHILQSAQTCLTICILFQYFCTTPISYLYPSLAMWLDLMRCVLFSGCAFDC
jgi:hypothetical protein